MRNSLRSKDGSAIVWAMAVAGFLLIIVSAVLTIALSYSNRSLNNVETRQLYLTARSGVDLIVHEFTNPDSKQTPKIYGYLQQEPSHKWTVDDVSFAQPKMGSCSLEVTLQEPEPPKKPPKEPPKEPAKKDALKPSAKPAGTPEVVEPPEDTESILTVVATATKNGKSQSVKVTLIGVILREGDEPKPLPKPDPAVPVDPNAPVEDPPRQWYVSVYENGGREGGQP